MCLSTGGRGVCLSVCWDAHPPSGADTPPDQAPPGSRHTPPRPGTPPTRHPPPGADPPQEQTPPRKQTAGIRLTSGRYASYWNAFLLFQNISFIFFWGGGDISLFRGATDTRFGLLMTSVSKPEWIPRLHIFMQQDKLTNVCLNLFCRQNYNNLH